MLISNCLIHKHDTSTITELTKFLKQIAEPNRLMILCLLQRGELSVNEIQAQLELPLNLVSFHLRSLKKVGLLDSKKIGLSVIYSLNEQKIISYKESLNSFLCVDCEKESFFKQSQNLSKI